MAQRCGFGCEGEGEKELPRPVLTLTQGVILQVVFNQVHDSYEKNPNLI